jgi:hypothetical protein
MYRSQRTMTRFQRGALSKRSHDSLMGREEKANVEHLFATGDLQRTVSLGNEMQYKETTNVSSYSFH